MCSLYKCFIKSQFFFIFFLNPSFFISLHLYFLLCIFFWSLQDLPDALDDAAVTEALELHRIKNRQWAIFKASAIKGEGLFEGLDW